MDASTVLLVLLALFTKHLVVDFPMQTPYHYMNKGTYLHHGGIQHALQHGYGTFFALFWFVRWDIAALMALIDIVIHYHIDWAKMNLNKKLKWGPTTHEEFWWLLGADQYAHALTYLWIVWMIV